jgi:hypothetical protein
VREADRKGLGQIAQELRALAQQAREAETREVELFNRYVKLFPFPFLRRALIRAAWSSPQLRRKLVGTLQFSNIGHFGIDAAHVPVVGELLLVGGVVEKRAVPDGQGGWSEALEARFRLHGSHRKVNGQTAGLYIATFRSVLAEPDRLD